MKLNKTEQKIVLKDIDERIAKLKKEQEWHMESLTRLRARVEKGEYP